MPPKILDKSRIPDFFQGPNSLFRDSNPAPATNLKTLILNGLKFFYFSTKGWHGRELRSWAALAAEGGIVIAAIFRVVAHGNVRLNAG